ncbi:MAG TPA: mannose-1-phosphate guanylyltransferase [Pusillimonas sp.]|jgi:MurNAc alpha-1-phosphate uridylyltransferase|nr:mannose-1-phosphate guanylyltransferase [Pusillimonas sp.]MBC43348.1 mannose-1-phosphate guanylyltransferase [Pusillimonas sp.]HBT33005.1 mannose-1-phosphate guanylyltransferase [Pusillimonas sp.]HCN70383.1 mannose-1-phosphate guanylyltransferase [Pusillimonas sp.]HCP77646.1 mannose-1-phosphate guanylyltransferase [Pusillimonas sp.]|tara:strand:+ start:100860 stop:101555 length:696 start_codon:yes stop_codon:yes gene_type:complete
MHAMILAAGRGERMRPLTDHTPKPLLPIAGKPLIVWHIERLVAAGITEIVINHAWLGTKIEATLGNGQAFGATLAYSPEEHALETAGGIARALPLLGTDPFLVVNGDVWCDWSPQNAPAHAHTLLNQNKKAWLLMVSNPDHHPHGDFYLDTTDELRHSNDGRTGRKLTFSGIGVYQPAMFSSIPDNAPHRLAPVLRKAMDNHEVIGAHYNGCWVDVGTPDRLQVLESRLQS